MKKVTTKVILTISFVLGTLVFSGTAKADWGFSVGVSTGGFGGYIGYNNPSYYGGGYYINYNSYNNYNQPYNLYYGYGAPTVSSYYNYNQPYYNNYQYVPAYLPPVNSYYYYGCSYYYGC